MFFYITITTKEKTTLKKFLMFFSKFNTSILYCLKLRAKKRSTKIVTVLKSPHINKTAQEQFEFRFFSRQIVLFSLNPVLCLGVLKSITKKRFPGIKIKLICVFDKKKQIKVSLSLLNPDSLKLKKNCKEKLFANYLKMFDLYGEVCLQNFLK